METGKILVGDKDAGYKCAKRGKYLSDRGRTRADRRSGKSEKFH